MQKAKFQGGDKFPIFFYNGRVPKEIESFYVAKKQSQAFCLVENLNTYYVYLMQKAKTKKKKKYTSVCKSVPFWHAVSS